MEAKILFLIKSLIEEGVLQKNFIGNVLGMNWFVYIAQSINGRYYTGVTTNPKRRINEHNSGIGAKFAKDHGSLKLVYVSFSYKDKSEAWKREWQIKGWSRLKKKEKLINKEWK